MRSLHILSRGTSMSHFKQNPLRGQQGVAMLTKFLEQQHCILSVSKSESNYSAGTQYTPDMIFMQYAIEAKRLEMVTSVNQPKRGDFRTALNWLKVNSDSWVHLKEFCVKNKKIPILIVILTWGKQEPIFIAFTEQQIDHYQIACQNREAAKPEPLPEGKEGFYYPHQQTEKEFRGWHFGANTFDLLKDGTILNQPESFHKFFACLNHNLLVQVFEKPLHEVYG